jgi:tripartite-type tricarboxylate transporter receptor subunit TctC
VENRVGAGGDLATEYVARSKPDGYTMLITGAGAIAGIMSLRKNPPIDTAKTIQVIAALHRQSFMVVVDAKTPYRSLHDLTKAMLLKGDKANFGTNELNGTVIGTIYKNATGVTAQEVAYRTANDTVNDLSSGALDFAIHNPLFALVQQRDGRMRILGIAANERMASQPDLPTLTEQGVAMDILGWWCVSVAAGTPQVAIDQINKWFVDIVGSDESKKFLNDAGGDPFILSPAQAQELFLKEIDKWRERVKLAKITPQ